MSYARRPAHMSSQVARRRGVARWAPLVMIAAGVLSLLPATAAAAAEAPPLATSDGFAILATTGITNTGPTVVNGDIGTAPNPSQPGYEDMIHTGTNHGDSTVTQTAQADALAAYNNALINAPTEIPTELGGTVVPLAPGVYDSASGEFGITGTLTLDGLNNPDSVFIFQAGSTLTTAAASNVLFINDAQPCNVFWIVGSSATFGAASYLGGTVLADTSISAGNSATFDGRLFALDGAVTLDTNTITVPTCAAAIPTTTLPTATTVPETTTTTAATTTTTSPVTTTTTALVTTSTTTGGGTTATTGPVTPTTGPGSPTTGLGTPGPGTPDTTPLSPPARTTGGDAPRLPETGSDHRGAGAGVALIAGGLVLLGISNRALRGTT